MRAIRSVATERRSSPRHISALRALDVLTPSWTSRLKSQAITVRVATKKIYSTRLNSSLFGRESAAA